MHDRTECALLEARQSMIRVWLTISAVWVAFWLITAGIVLTAAERLAVHPVLFLLIVATPPLLLLAVGAVSRWAFELFALRARDN